MHHYFIRRAGVKELLSDYLSRPDCREHLIPRAVSIYRERLLRRRE